jgi:hypothetical protein
MDQGHAHDHGQGSGCCGQDFAGFSFHGTKTKSSFCNQFGSNATAIANPPSMDCVKTTNASPERESRTRVERGGGRTST